MNTTTTDVDGADNPAAHMTMVNAKRPGVDGQTGGFNARHTRIDGGDVADCRPASVGGGFNAVDQCRREEDDSHLGDRHGGLVDDRDYLSAVPAAPVVMGFDG